MAIFFFGWLWAFALMGSFPAVFGQSLDRGPQVIVDTTSSDHSSTGLGLLVDGRLHWLEVESSETSRVPGQPLQTRFVLAATEPVYVVIEESSSGAQGAWLRGGEVPTPLSVRSYTPEDKYLIRGEVLDGDEFVDAIAESVQGEWEGPRERTILLAYEDPSSGVVLFSVAEDSSLGTRLGLTLQAWFLGGPAGVYELVSPWVERYQDESWFETMLGFSFRRATDRLGFVTTFAAETGDSGADSDGPDIAVFFIDNNNSAVITRFRPLLRFILPGLRFVRMKLNRVTDERLKSLEEMIREGRLPLHLLRRDLRVPVRLVTVVDPNQWAGLYLDRPLFPSSDTPWSLYQLRPSGGWEEIPMRGLPAWHDGGPMVVNIEPGLTLVLPTRRGSPHPEVAGWIQKVLEEGGASGWEGPFLVVKQASGGTAIARLVDVELSEEQIRTVRLPGPVGSEFLQRSCATLFEKPSLRDFYNLIACDRRM